MTIATPPGATFGYVDGTFGTVVGDQAGSGADVDRYPDFKPAEGTIAFVSGRTKFGLTSPRKTVFFPQTVTCTIDKNTGRLTDPAGAPGCWLLPGTYTVRYTIKDSPLTTSSITVTSAHTLATPLDLYDALMQGEPPLETPEGFGLESFGTEAFGA